MDIINWFITSSADPEKTSSALKGTLKVIVAEFIRYATAACAVGFARLCFGDLSWLDQAIELTGQAVYLILALWGVIQAAYGLARKVRLGRWSAAAL